MSSEKPIWYHDPDDPLFRERLVSGYSHHSTFTKLLSGGNMLTVVLTEDRLIIHPVFPFTATILPNLGDHEHEIPLQEVLDVRRKESGFTGLFSGMQPVVVEFMSTNTSASKGKRAVPFSLQLSDPDSFRRTFQSVSDSNE